MAAFSSTFALRRIGRRHPSESEEINTFHDVIREQLASIYQDLYPTEDTVSLGIQDSESKTNINVQRRRIGQPISDRHFHYLSH